MKKKKVKSSNKSRIVFVDFLRVLAIALVIIFHYYYQVNKNDSLRDLGFIGISLFFIVSGYMLALKYKDMEKFKLKWFIKRFIKIASLYYIALIVVVLLFQKQAYSSNLIENLFYHFLFLDNLSANSMYGIISPAWFLTPLLCLYLFYPYINQIVKKYPYSIFLIFLLMDLIRLKDKTYTSYFFLFFIGEFCFGMLYAYGHKKKAIIASFLTIIVTPMMFLPFIIFILFSYVKYIPLQRTLTFLGVNTLALFLFHEAFIKILLDKWYIFSLDKISALTALTIAAIFSVYLSNKVQIYFNKKLDLC